MTIRLRSLVALSLSLAGACSSTGSLQDSRGGAGGGAGGGGAGGGQSGTGGGQSGTGGGQSGTGEGGSGGGGTAGAAPPTMEISGLAYGNGTFVAVGAELQNPQLWTGVIHASTDGTTW